MSIISPPPAAAHTGTVLIGPFLPPTGRESAVDRKAAFDKDGIAVNFVRVLDDGGRDSFVSVANLRARTSRDVWFSGSWAPASADGRLNRGRQ